MNAHVRTSATLNLRTHSLIAFVLTPAEPLADWYELLDGWLARSPNFFANKPIILDLAQLDVALKDYRDLLSALARRHIRVMGVENASKTRSAPIFPRPSPAAFPSNPSPETSESAPRDEIAAPPVQPERPSTGCSQTLIVDLHVRSGQSITNLAGDITIIGRVSSGAEVIAGGSVHVYGAIQGRVFAGVSGIPDARTTARKRAPNCSASAAPM